MAAVHYAPAAMHHLRGIDALLSAVSVHFFGGIFSLDEIGLPCLAFSGLGCPDSIGMGCLGKIGFPCLDYSGILMERACALLLAQTTAPTYQQVKNILSKGIDASRSETPNTKQEQSAKRGFQRGAEYFGGSTHAE